MSKALKDYIETVLSHGGTRDSIRSTLTQAGWSGQVVDKYLSQYVGVDDKGVPIPAPRLQSHQIARDLFLYILTLVTLGMTTCAVGVVLFQLIGMMWPDTVGYDYNRASGGTSWAIAQVIIAFPVFTLLSVFIGKDISASPEKRESLIRKLMIYLILVLSAIVALGDLTVTLFNLLEGGLTLRFMAKAAVVLGISLLVFVYYLYEMRQDDRLIREGGWIGRTRLTLSQILWGFSALICLGAIAGGFFLTGGPSYQRLLRHDADRISRLRSLSDGIHNFVRQEKRLPESFAQMKANPTIYLAPESYVDPVSKVEFEYVPEQTTYQLCAVFETASAESRSQPGYSSYPEETKWRHPKGHHCVHFDVKQVLRGPTLTRPIPD